jgi:hypothetical protein
MTTEKPTLGYRFRSHLFEFVIQSNRSLDPMVSDDKKYLEIPVKMVISLLFMAGIGFLALSTVVRNRIKSSSED